MDLSKMNEDELLLTAAALAITLAKGRTRKEVVSTINFLNLVAANMQVGLDQRVSLVADDTESLFSPFL